jgi:hypothetical protein
VTLKPKHKLRGTGRVHVQLRVAAFDGAGNRTGKTIRFTVK